MAEGPMKAYLAAAVGLVKQYAWAFPAFKKPQGVTNPKDIDLRTLSAEENAAILDFAFHRYFEESGLFGTVEDALARVEQLKRIGVTEVACLIDYGIAPEKVMEGLYPLAEVVRLANAGGGVEDDDYSIAAQILRHGVTHLPMHPVDGPDDCDERRGAHGAGRGQDGAAGRRGAAWRAGFGPAQDDGGAPPEHVWPDRNDDLVVG